uniref:Uncharacterized protein n=1 Tax=Tetranychus urticae TaxID=32264 RepID=T1K9X3_TETUR
MTTLGCKKNQWTRRVCDLASICLLLDKILAIDRAKHRIPAKYMKFFCNFCSLFEIK